MPQQLFQGSDTVTWPNIPSLLVPSIYTSRKALFCDYCQIQALNGKERKQQAQAISDRQKAGRQRAWQVSPSFITCPVFSPLPPAFPQENTSPPQCTTRQEPGLLLLSVGSHFSLTNYIRRHFLFCLCNPYLCFRTSPVTLSYKPVKEDKHSFFLPGDCSLWIIITTLLSCPCTAEIHIFIPFHLFL